MSRPSVKRNTAPVRQAKAEQPTGWVLEVGPKGSKVVGQGLPDEFRGYSTLFPGVILDGQLCYPADIVAGRDKDLFVDEENTDANAIGIDGEYYVFKEEGLFGDLQPGQWLRTESHYICRLDIQAEEWELPFYLTPQSGSEEDRIMDALLRNRASFFSGLGDAPIPYNRDQEPRKPSQQLRFPDDEFAFDNVREEFSLFTVGLSPEILQAYAVISSLIDPAAVEAYLSPARSAEISVDKDGLKQAFLASQPESSASPIAPSHAKVAVTLDLAESDEIILACEHTAEPMTIGPEVLVVPLDEGPRQLTLEGETVLTITCDTDASGEEEDLLMILPLVTPKGSTRSAELVCFEELLGSCTNLPYETFQVSVVNRSAEGKTARLLPYIHCSEWGPSQARLWAEQVNLLSMKLSYEGFFDDLTGIGKVDAGAFRLAWVLPIVPFSRNFSETDLPVEFRPVSPYTRPDLTPCSEVLGFPVQYTSGVGILDLTDDGVLVSSRAIYADTWKQELMVLAEVLGRDQPELTKVFTARMLGLTALQRKDLRMSLLHSRKEDTPFPWGFRRVPDLSILEEPGLFMSIHNRTSDLQDELQELVWDLGIRALRVQLMPSAMSQPKAGPMPTRPKVGDRPGSAKKTRPKVGAGEPAATRTQSSLAPSAPLIREEHKSEARASLANLARTGSKPREKPVDLSKLPENEVWIDPDNPADMVRGTPRPLDASGPCDPNYPKEPGAHNKERHVPNLAFWYREGSLTTKVEARNIQRMFPRVNSPWQLAALAAEARIGRSNPIAPRLDSVGNVRYVGKSGKCRNIDHNPKLYGRFGPASDAGSIRSER